ncbi:MAG: hypothetical protein QG670_2715 [Thermoproteota archaeon]|nr:hypothetical protein [Thermoproteota archaeon]
MIWSRILIAGLIIFLACSSLNVVYGIPSGGVYPPKFTLIQGDWYDSWGYDRNNAEGSDGYLPNIAYESLGTNKELAYNIGLQFKANYPSRTERAEKILQYVQRWTDYGYDEDSEAVIHIAGTHQGEWAWNADEMVHMFNQTTGTIAIGDCEDMSFLCTTIYVAAGFDVVLVSPVGHVALMIWLPEYDNANIYWDIGDGRGEGWIWVEATGGDNTLGWTPSDFNDGNFEVYPLVTGISTVNYSPQNPQAEDNVTITASVTSQNNQISQVQLHYSVDGSTSKTITMTMQGLTYKATIPRQNDGAVVSFYIIVTYTGGDTFESSEFSYTVGGGFGLPDLKIPGFPVESIIIGLIIGIMTLYFLSRKRSGLSIMNTSTH